jgi:hypothetical protein
MKKAAGVGKIHGVAGCFRSALIVFLAIILSGCAAAHFDLLASSSPVCDETLPDDQTGARFSLFLNLEHPDPPEVEIEVLDVELLIDDQWVGVLSAARLLNSKVIGTGQVFLAGRKLAGRSCKGVRLTIGSTYLLGSGGKRPLTLATAETALLFQNGQLDFADGDSRVLKLVWDVEASLDQDGFTGLALRVEPEPVTRITSNLAYVACPEIDTVFAIMTDKRQVYDALAVSGSPSYLVIDEIEKKIIVLAPAEESIKIYNLTTNDLDRELKIPMAHGAEYLAVSADRQVGYVLDRQGILTSLDLVSGVMLNRDRIGKQPNYLIDLPGQGKLALSSTIDQSLYLVNSQSLAVEEIIPLSAPAAGLALWGNFLYIAEKSVNDVEIYDLGERRMLRRVVVGQEPSRIQVNGNNVYIANRRDGSLSVMPGGQLSVSKVVAVGDEVGEMAVAENQHLLFVGEESCAGKIAVLDSTANQVIGKIELGARPHGIAVLE